MAQVAAEQAAQGDRRPVICLGDSHTRGFYGASWLNLLRPQFPHLRFINAGRDGEPSESIAARLPPLLEAHPDPAAVLLFSGSNDCIAQESEDLQAWYKRSFWLSQTCSEQYALQNLEKKLQLVQERAPAAKTIVINLPVMVEDPTHTANQRAHKYSNAVANLVKQKYPGVGIVDFQTACRQYMAQHSPKWQQAMQDMQQQGKEPSDVSISSTSSASSGGQQLVLSKYRLAWNMAWSKFYMSMLRWRSWNEISAYQGLLLLTDQIHMNDTAAGILAGLVQPLLKDV